MKIHSRFGTSIIKHLKLFARRTECQVSSKPPWINAMRRSNESYMLINVRIIEVFRYHTNNSKICCDRY